MPLTFLFLDGDAGLRELAAFLEAHGHAVIRPGCRSAAEALPPADAVVVDADLAAEPDAAVAAILDRARHQGLPRIAAGERARLDRVGIGAAEDVWPSPVEAASGERRLKLIEAMAALRRRLDGAERELRARGEAGLEDARIAGQVMHRLTRLGDAGDPLVCKHVRRAAGRRGDIVLSCRGQNDVLYGLLADAAGAGLGAMLTLMPVVHTFETMAHKGFGLGAIAREINRQVRSRLPPDRFVAVTLLAVNAAGRTIDVWNGGNPAVAFLDRDGRCQRLFESSHLPIGVATLSKFNGRVEHWRWDGPGTLVALSDGVVLARGVDGSRFGTERALAALGGRAAPADLDAALDRFGAPDPPEDDQSLLLVRCEEQETRNAQSQVFVGAARAEEEGDWSPQWDFSVRLGGRQLAASELLPLILTWIEAMGVTGLVGSKLFLVLTELLNNAVDHGLLGLESAVKAEPGGFERYMELRSERLARLEHGSVAVEISCAAGAAGQRFVVTVRDSGQGFDTASLMAEEAFAGRAHSGRGIALVRSLCSAVEYLGQGNIVKATLEAPPLVRV